MTGGTEASNYYLSLNHMDQEGIIDASSMRRESLRVSVQTQATPWLKIGFQGNLGYTKYEQNNASNAIYAGDGVYGTNPMVFARKALPVDAPNYYTIDDNGNLIWGERASLPPLLPAAHS